MASLPASQQEYSNTILGLQYSADGDNESLILAAPTANGIFIYPDDGSTAIPQWSGDRNIVIGSQHAGTSITSGYENVIVGPGAGAALITTGANTMMGYQAGQVSTGSNNVYIGFAAGFSNTTGSNNVYIAANGATTTETATIRIGSSFQTAAYMTAIDGQTAGGSDAVLVGSNGLLGTAAPSLAGLKNDIKPMASEGRFDKIGIVSFSYKDDASKCKRYGMLVEDLIKLYPECCSVKDNKPYGVMHHRFIPIMIKEIQELKNEISKLKAKMPSKEIEKQ